MPTTLPVASRLALIAAAWVAASAFLDNTCRAADGRTERQAEVSHRGGEVMPFDLSATMHVFSKTSDGGIQRVIAKDPADATQVRKVREHLRDLCARFRRGDWSGPKHIHGADMPGLPQLEQARPGQLSVVYADAKAGAQLTFRSRDSKLVEAIHRWFDAQLSDHGPDAMEERHHPHHPGADAAR